MVSFEAIIKYYEEAPVPGVSCELNGIDCTPSLPRFIQKESVHIFRSVPELENVRLKNALALDRSRTERLIW